jgi:hypothetical protein
VGDNNRQPEEVQLLASHDGQMFVYDPRSRRHEPVDDARDEMEEMSRQHPTTEEEQEAFYLHRQKLLEESDLSEQQKARSEVTVEKALKYVNRNPPVPGGVGAGVWYRNGQLLFQRSTALYHYIIAPSLAGGVTNTWLYLTATNRAAKGVEAFASYFAQENPIFKVFDWAKPEDQHWALAIPYAQLGKYLIALNLTGQTFQALYVINITRLLGGTRWANEVLLHNQETGRRDLVYSYDYTLASNDQQHWGGWAPIVETFQDDYGTTNPVGFWESLLVQDGVERQLTEATTYIEDNKHGIQMFQRVSNHSFLAH